MLDINFCFEDYSIKSVKEEGLESLAKWMRENNSEDRTCYSLDDQMFYRRFLEYYVTNDECFLEIYKDKELVGVFKGRINNEITKELFIWLFVVKKEYRNKGLGSKIMDGIIEYFISHYTVDTIKVGVVYNNIEGVSFWDAKEFKVSRVIQNFFQEEVDKGRNLVIMER